LDDERAFVLGLVHDIGRRFGRSNLRHTTDGYRYLREQGHAECAAVCLSHSFPTRELESYFGEMDVDSNDLDLLTRYLGEAEYTELDRLIQLCDHLAHPDGYCVVEKRMIDVALRYGVHEGHRRKWAEVIRIRESFHIRIGKPVYAVLPGVVSGTFGTEDLPALHADDPEYRAMGAIEEPGAPSTDAR
jgi:hypothetical protein